MENEMVQLGSLKVNKLLLNLGQELAAQNGLVFENLWKSFEQLLINLTPKNAALLRRRDELQAAIDVYCLERQNKRWDAKEYESFLTKIGYLTPEPADFKVQTTKVDPELSKISGPQLVVPVDNSRYALNAVNARWGSLLDAFYGTDAGPPETNGAERSKKGYNPIRGARVFEYVHDTLDKAVPLNGALYKDVLKFSLKGSSLEMKMKSGSVIGLADPTKFVGYNTSSSGEMSSVLLRNNGLHFELLFDPTSKQSGPAGLAEVLVESAITAIMDMEDSVAAVDAQDKERIYRNWAGLNDGTLCTVLKGGKKRVAKPDRSFMSPTAGKFTLPGRSLMLVRNVGIHMYTDAVTTPKGNMLPEGIIDAFFTVLGAYGDLTKKNTLRNSREGSVYIVKPKMHGPEEVEFVVGMFAELEKIFNLTENTLKIGIMDEERRTTVNLSQCINIAKNRCIFINTGFMDRTGDEIHTTMMNGAMITKDEIKSATWRTAYEAWNVEVGIAHGLVGNAQIGKGMWDKPDKMADMMKSKSSHPASGATCAWVPSPTAGTLHALHYHDVDVYAVQQKLAAQGRRATKSDILLPPLVKLGKSSPAQAAIAQELENSAQGILGYVVRWVQQGVGCSKVPDRNNVGLMEDRATLRITSQLMANWLTHQVISKVELMGAFERMAVVVDKQNQGDSLYRPMSPSLSDNAYQCAVELVLNGVEVPNGYTEFSLHKFRRAEKAKMAQLPSKL